MLPNTMDGDKMETMEGDSISQVERQNKQTLRNKTRNG